MRLFWTVLLVCLPLFAEAPTSPLRVPFVTRPPKLADFLTGTPRQAEVVVTEFVQFDPVDGAPVSRPTTAYLSHDKKNLYVAFVCKDEPDQIRARIARRKDIMTDDRVTINIDTFHDHRHAYFFDVNPYGVQLDGRTTDGQGDDFSWESLWYTDTKLTPDGYVVLETIPFRSLRFPDAEKQVWGVVLGRFIQRNNEMSLWPAMSRKRLPQFVGQYGDMEISEDISPGRNMQFIPYGMFTNSRYLDGANGFKTQTEARGGLDAKMVIKDALTLDVALNPDFSQVESDEPQVTINQRYEVFFPEKRPFFMENASLFNTPEQLFFTRRIVDPQFGVRLTGTMDRWSLGVLAADDRAPGKMLGAGDALRDNRAAIGIVRLEREFGRQSHFGVLATSRDFGDSSNRVGSFDTRIGLGRNWWIKAQATTSETRLRGGQHLSGPAWYAAISQSTKNFNYTTTYTDRSPNFRADVGYIPRVDIRELKHEVSYRWRPEGGKVVSFGPDFEALTNWNRLDQLQDWSGAVAFHLELPRLTTLEIVQTHSFELFQRLGFHKNDTGFEYSTEWYKWLALKGELHNGTGVNYYPGRALLPFLGRSKSASVGVTVRPAPQFRIDESYLYSWLGAERQWLADNAGAAPGTVFNNHILRTKVNYQFNRELSVRAILDYNGVLPNPSLVSLDPAKKFGTDLLLTYFLHPGTALYVGYSNLLENMIFDPLESPALRRTLFPDLMTGRQVFVKLSYMLRF